MKVKFTLTLMVMLFMQTNVSCQPINKEDPPKNVVVVGAGLAGLTAAYRLQQAGYTVDVYEARERPGGRVYTFSLGESYVELGGQSIEDGGEANAIRHLIQEMDLTLETAWQNRTFSHSILVDNLLEKGSNFILKAPSADQTLWNQLLFLAQHSQNLGEVLDQLCEGKNPAFRRYFEMYMRNFEGSDTHHLSVFYISSFFQLLNRWQLRASKQDQGDPLSLPLTHVKGGNSRLVKALVKKLQRPIHYNSVLTKITRDQQNRLFLHFNSSKVVSADCIILALPCSTLRDVDIEEGLFPRDQMEAIQTLQYGTNGKIALPIYLPSLPTSEVLCLEDCFSWFNHDYSILILYYGGEKGVFPFNTQEDIQKSISKVLPSIRLAYPEALFPEDIHPIGISWKLEKFSKGSYSNFGPNQEKIFNNYIEIEGESIKSVFRPIHHQIFFAGEHTSIDYPATLEGAVESGEKVSRLIQAFKPLDKK